MLVYFYWFSIALKQKLSLFEFRTKARFLNSVIKFFCNSAYSLYARVTSPKYTPVFPFGFLMRYTV